MTSPPRIRNIAETSPDVHNLGVQPSQPAKMLTAVATMGLAAGVGYLMVNDALSAWLSDIRLDVTSIGMLALCALPYGLKFLWAPLMDFHSFPGLHWLGRRRSWLVATMIACIGLIVALAWVSSQEAFIKTQEPCHPPASWLALVGALAFALAFCSASLDVVVDAYRADSVTNESLGMGASMYVAGWRAAVVVAGAALLMLPDRIGWPLAIAAMGVVMLIPLIATLIAREPKRGHAPVSFSESVVFPIKDFQHRFGGHALALLAFILLYRLPDLVAGRMVMPFLMQELHFTKDEIGLLRQFGGAIVTIIGAISGGMLVKRMGVPKCLMVFGVLQAASNGGYLLLLWTGHSLWGFGIAVAVENFCNGLVASVFVAYLMSLCSAKASATQYAIFTGLMFGAAALLGAPTGYLVDKLGYGWFFTISIALGVPGILLIPVVSRLGRESISQGDPGDGETPPPRCASRRS